MHAFGLVLMLLGPTIFIMIACWYLLAPVPWNTKFHGRTEKGAYVFENLGPRNECECAECMEPGLRGPSRTSLD